MLTGALSNQTAETTKQTILSFSSNLSKIGILKNWFKTSQINSIYSSININTLTF